MDDVRRAFARSGLYRSNDSVLGGVFAGLGNRVGLSPWQARIAFTLLLLFVPGSQLLIYPVLWILMPREGSVLQGPGPR